MKDAQFFFQTFDGAGTEVGEYQPGACNKILDGTGDPNLAVPGEVTDAGSNVDGNPADVIVFANLDFPGVEASPNGNPKWPNAARDSLSASHGTSRSIKRCKNAIAEGFHLSSTESPKLAASQGEMRIQDRPPFRVAKGSGLLGGIDDIREEHRGQDAVRFNRLLRNVYEFTNFR
jgi:hypothetical protein